MTNFEKIKNMSLEELADTISNELIDCDSCPIREFHVLHNYDTSDELETCAGIWKQWLKSEVEEWEAL